MSRKVGHLKSRFAAGALVFGALLAGLAELRAQQAPGAPPRLALVIGEAAYKTGPLSSAANDAGLVADTLQLAGFDVTGAADLDQDGLRRALREFVEKAATAGPDATVFIYLSGRAVQYEGDNYLAPVEATIPRAADTPLEAVRLSDYLQPLAQTPLRARIVVLDAARINAFAQSTGGLASGLALVEPESGELIAYNAAPDSVAPNETGPYGVYAQALTEMLREGGLPVDEAFARVRLRVSQQTQGAQVPWDESKLSPAPVLFARAPGAPPPSASLETQANLRARPIRDYPVDQAYAAALEQDTIAAYVDFLGAYPNSAYARRVRAMLALRREAVTWRRAWLANTPSAYWTYLHRYPRGPHAEDARRRLAMLNAALMPPAQYDAYEFDVPPPPEDEQGYFDRPYVVFDDRDYGAPPPMGYLLPERREWIEHEPPPPPRQGLLPLPLVAAPLLFAIPALRHGLFHAPAVVQTRDPGANDYYNEHNRRAQGAPAANPSSAAPAAPAGQNPAGSPLPHGRPNAPGAQKPAGSPLPHAPPPAPHVAPPAPHIAPPPAPHFAPPPPHVAPPAPHIAPPAPHFAPPPPHVAPHLAPPPAPHFAPPAPHIAPPPAPHFAPPPPHVAPPAPHIAPPAPHFAPPPPHVAPHLAPPPAPHFAAPPPRPAPPPHVAPPAARPAPPQHERPHCGAPGEPPCR